MALPWIPIATTKGPEGPATIVRFIEPDGWIDAGKSDNVKYLNSFISKTIGSFGRDVKVFGLIEPDNGIRTLWTFTVHRAGPSIHIRDIWSPFIFRPGDEKGTLLRSLILWTLRNVFSLHLFNLQHIALTAKDSLFLPHRFITPDAFESLRSPSAENALELLPLLLGNYELEDETDELGYWSRTWRLYLAGPIIRLLEWSTEEGYGTVWRLKTTDHHELAEATDLGTVLVQGEAFAIDRGPTTEADWLDARTANATFLQPDLVSSYRLLGLPLPYADNIPALKTWFKEIQS